MASKARGSEAQVGNQPAAPVARTPSARNRQANAAAMQHLCRRVCGHAAARLVVSYRPQRPPWVATVARHQGRVGLESAVGDRDQLGVGVGAQLAVGGGGGFAVTYLVPL